MATSRETHFMHITRLTTEIFITLLTRRIKSSLSDRPMFMNNQSKRDVQNINMELCNHSEIDFVPEL